MVATYVLVPGGWDGTWHWRSIAQLLQAPGHEVLAVTLTGLGERAHLAPISPARKPKRNWASLVES